MVELGACKSQHEQAIVVNREVRDWGSHGRAGARGIDISLSLWSNGLWVLFDCNQQRWGVYIPYYE